MNLPTLESVKDDTRKYREYLKAGGKPIRIILELKPTEIGLDWIIETQMEDSLLELTWIAMFVKLIRQFIIEAVQPWKTKEEMDRIS